MKKLIIFAAIFLTPASALAQDPYMPDTVIVDTVYVDSGQPYADVPIYAVTDDSVAFYNLPLTWLSDFEGIEPSEFFYDYPLRYWDTYDSVIFNWLLIRMIGYDQHDYFFIRTDSLRWNCWTMRFTIDSLAPPQIAVIDTTYDPINGPLLLGLRDGITSFTPIFIPGAIYYGITTDVDEKNQNLPDDFTLLRNYPNPFNASTTIEFILSEEMEIELAIYNILGQKIDELIEEHKPAGRHSLVWHSGELPSGVYFARLEKEGKWKTMRMLLMK